MHCSHTISQEQSTPSSPLDLLLISYFSSVLDSSLPFTSYYSFHTNHNHIVKTFTFDLIFLFKLLSLLFSFFFSLFFFVFIFLYFFSLSFLFSAIFFFPLFSLIFHFGYLFLLVFCPVSVTTSPWPPCFSDIVIVRFRRQHFQS